MEIVTKQYYCDRCHKDLSNGVKFIVFDDIYSYQICTECKTIFDNYKKHKRAILKKIDNVEMTFRFGKYLPEYEVKND